MCKEIIKRYTIADLFQMKIKMLDEISEIEERVESLKGIDGHNYFRLEQAYEGRYQTHEKNIDRSMWNYLIQLFELQKYMLCTEFKKINEKINNYEFPEFTVENADGWIAGLKELIYDNVKVLVKKVFSEVSESYYRGQGQERKKRNNNGIDKFFIICNNDYARVHDYWYNPTITDDLEKVCYILDGKKLPEITIINKMRAEKSSIGNNDYFEIKIHKNCNTHYKMLNENIRNKLNILGGDPSRIGELCKIKIL